jgi:hypothetical protein
MARTTYSYLCENPACGKPFTSLKPDRHYCCMKCVAAASPSFKAAREAALVKARENYKPVARSGEERPCAHCGKPMYLKPSEIKRGKKTCNRTCYRGYMAARFDRAAAVSVTYRELQGYDEFLLQDKLPCLVEGCTWEGDNLSLHMNEAHGITEEDFKREAGFNLTTGVVSATMGRNLRARGNKGHEPSLDREKALKAPGRCEYVSRERLEHIRKSAALRTKVSE